MPTYLLCIVLGDLEKVLEKDLITINDTKVNGYAPSNIVKNIEFSVIKNYEALEFFENWFIATTKDNPLIKKWHEVYKQYWY